MAYVLIVDGMVSVYPYPEYQLRLDNPGTSFPQDVSNTNLSDFGVFTVAEIEKPEITSEQTVDEGTPELINGIWTQTWVKRNFTSNELKAAKKQKWEQVKAKREEKWALGAAVPGIGTFQTDRVSMASISEGVLGSAIAAITSQPFTVMWTLDDNSTVELDGTTMMAVGKFIGERKAAIHLYSQTLRTTIESVTTFSGLNYIDIDEGWPD